MSRKTITLLAWWFLMASKGGSFAPGIYMNIGPFAEEADCRHLRDEMAGKPDHIAYASACWNGGETSCPPVIECNDQKAKR